MRNPCTKSAPNDAHESCGDADNGSTPRASRAWCFRLRTPGAFGRSPNGHPHAGAFSVLPPQACECLRPREPGRGETDIAHTAKAFNRAAAVPGAGTHTLYPIVGFATVARSCWPSNLQGPPALRPSPSHLYHGQVPPKLAQVWCCRSAGRQRTMEGLRNARNRTLIVGPRSIGPGSEPDHPSMKLLLWLSCVGLREHSCP